MFVTITTTKKEVDYQFRYFERNKFIKEYKHIKENHSWNDEYEAELVCSEPAKGKCSPKNYDLRTPLKKSRKDDMESIMISDMFSDSASKIEYTN